jgi:hypothetical protein
MAGLAIGARDAPLSKESILVEAIPLLFKVGAGWLSLP